MIWFNLAKSWQEAQTGKIHLEEEHQYQVNDLLKFIYSGRKQNQFQLNIREDN